MQSFTGIVQKGVQRGRELGYPTVNIALSDPQISGIYAARVNIKGSEQYMAAAFADPSRKILEAHILDFSDELYGLEVTIELLEKIRESEKYTSDDALKDAIRSDIAKVREFFKN